MKASSLFRSVYTDATGNVTTPTKEQSMARSGLLAGILLTVFVGTLLSLAPSQSQGCAVARRPEEKVLIAEESAVIIWDAAAKIQHFIRRATFDAKAADFGFLVPTPTKPELAKVDESPFSFLENVIAPKTVVHNEFVPAACCMINCGRLGMPPPTATGVRVLEEKRVGSFDTAILEADDAGALNAWLAKNGYASNPELSWWLGQYVQAKWKITAFKIAADQKESGTVGSEAIRMSFATDRPFFPYREPEGAPNAKKDGNGYAGRRLLRVFFIADQRFTGTLGDGPWNARVYWADRMDSQARLEMIAKLGVPETSMSDQPWMTTFEDSASPRPAHDEVYFKADSDQTTKHPPDNVKTNTILMPLDLIVLGLLALLPFVWLIRAARRQTHAPAEK